MAIRFNDLPFASSVTPDDELAILDTADDIVKKIPLHKITERILNATDDFDTTFSGPITDRAISTFLSGSFGPVETSEGASKDYIPGETFIYNNKLAKAITAIAEDESIVVGTNATYCSAKSAVMYLIGPYTIPEGSQEYTVYNDSIGSNSIVWTMYDDIKKPVVASVGVDETIQPGRVIYHFGGPLADSATIFRIWILNP